MSGFYGGYNQNAPIYMNVYNYDSDANRIGYIMKEMPFPEHGCSFLTIAKIAPTIMKGGSRL